jgi:hypothetical protein
MASALETTFLLGWRAGITLFTERNDSRILEDGFKTASHLCSKDAIVQMTLSANRIMLDRIIERNASKPTDIQNLEEMGNDLAQLIMMSEGTLPPQ